MTQKISVVVPVYKHWDVVSDLIRALSEQTVPPELFELILVANDSGPERDLEHTPYKTQLLYCPKPGSYAARNVGWPDATSDIVAFTDADCRPDPTWIAQILAELAKTSETEILAGSIDIQPADRPTWFDDLDRMTGLPQETYVARGYAVTANLIVPKSILMQLGGFGENRFSGGDAEFCRAARAKGYMLRYCKGIRVTHPSRGSFSEHFQKLQRQRGGQLASGSLMRRLKYLIRTLLPPLRRSVEILKTRHSLGTRFGALVALYSLWLAGIWETCRLLLGGAQKRQ